MAEDAGKGRAKIAKMNCIPDGTKIALEAIAHFFRERGPEDPWTYKDESKTIEESYCRPLIRQKSDGMYYCTLHPDVISYHLGSIEHHVRFKDPERHRYKLETGLDLPSESRKA